MWKLTTVTSLGAVFSVPRLYPDTLLPRRVEEKGLELEKWRIGIKEILEKCKPFYP